MTREDLILNNCIYMADIISKIITENERKNEVPFIVGGSDHKDLAPLVTNIIDLYNHPQQNSEIIYFLVRLVESYEPYEEVI